MRKIFKQTLPALLIAVIASFILFIYEPVIMYANNINDFWFDLGTIFPTYLLFFLICTIIICLFFLITIVISKKTKAQNLYNVAIVVALSIFIIAYIHGNFLAGMLPDLDGDVINWWDFWPNFVSAVICVGVIATMVVCCKKFSIAKVAKNSIYPVLVIFAMLLASFISTIMTTSALDQKPYLYSVTNENINTISSDQNLLVFVVDAADSATFNKVVESDEKYQSIFQDFTYYPDITSGYPFTRDSIPFLLTGVWNNNETNFSEYSTEAYNESPLINQLKAENYNINIYEEDLIWQDENVFQISNIYNRAEINTTALFKQQLKYDLFKYLPAFLKFASKADGINFAKTRSGSYSYLNKDNYATITNNPNLEKTDQKYFQFYHIEGAHVPFDSDEYFNDKADATYEDKIKQSLTIINAYLNRLKDNQAYDNSAIVIVADHGYSIDCGVDGRQNPILYVKGINETYSAMHQSDKAVSQIDFQNLYSELMNGEAGEELFSEVTDGNRLYHWYVYNREENMVEYEVTGAAWETDKMLKTGKEFNL